MHLKSLSLQNFRSYTKASFEFSENTTFVIGPNTAGKTNLIESLYFLSFGKGFRTQNSLEAIRIGKEFTRIKAKVLDTELEVFLSTGTVQNIKTSSKRYLVNSIGKRRIDFMGHFPTVLFSPVDLDLITGSPSLRREFLNEALESADREYRYSLLEYTKALKQRNSLLHLAKERGVRNKEQFEYWDELVIRNGQIVTKKREEFIIFLNEQVKEVFESQVVYDPSIISRERLLQYEKAEVDSGVTLVGPHRDDFLVLMKHPSKKSSHDVSQFGSRGQQRLVVLQLKLLEILFMEKTLGKKPTLLLDDVFSELDENHIKLVLEKTKGQQTIITTTHKEFIDPKLLLKASVIELGK